MKSLNYIMLFIGCITLVAYSSNPPTGKTGGPGEGKCSDCHNGGNYAGTISISNLPDTVMPNRTYTISLNVSSKAAKSGFEMLVMNGKNESQGFFLANSEVSSRIDNGKNYAAQITPKALISERATWTMNWTAPSIVANDSLIFYFTSNLTNGNGNTSGDNVILGRKKIILKKATALNENLSVDASNVKFLNGQLVLKGLDEDCLLSLIDLSGIYCFQVVVSNEMLSIDLPSNLKGVYIMRVVGSKFKFNKKIFIY